MTAHRRLCKGDSLFTFISNLSPTRFTLSFTHTSYPSNLSSLTSALISVASKNPSECSEQENFCTLFCLFPSDMIFSQIELGNALWLLGCASGKISYTAQESNRAKETFADFVFFSLNSRFS